MDEESAMSIIRVQKNKNYFAVSNQPFNDSSLSWEARGIMGYLLSKPDHWNIQFHDLVKQGPSGMYAIRRILKELEENHYLKRQRIQNSAGKFEWVSTVYEIPYSEENEETISRLTIDGSPIDGSTIDGKPRDIVSTESVSTESVNTELKDHHHSFSSGEKEKIKPPPVKKDELIPVTLGGIDLFEKLCEDASAKGRRGPKRFESLAQRDKFLEAEKRLGSRLEEAITCGLEMGITDRARLIAYIAKWGNGYKPANIPTYNRPPKKQREINLDGL